ncbi:MAG: xanthine dehydrogenase family protein subunit M [Desulfarculus sp.]|nr:xanthine dehydrogenase family protein subunit M [Desulfarculus sp.]
MAMPHFEHHQPTSLEEALDILTRHGAEAKLMGGGTDLVMKMRAGALEPRHVVGLGRVAGLNRISYRDDDGLVIGGSTRISEVAAHPEVRRHYPALAHACSVMATPQIRNMGTVAGNLANAAPSADTAAPLLACRASVVLVERGGRRQVKLTDFFKGPGLTDLEPGEILEAIRVPAPPNRCGSAYQRLSERSQVDIAAVGVAGFVALDLAGAIIGVRLALSAVAPTPVRCPEAEAILEGQIPTPELLRRASAACVRASRPIDDLRASANYRRSMVQVLSLRVLEQCLALAKGEASPPA